MTTAINTPIFSRFQVKICPTCPDAKISPIVSWANGPLFDRATQCLKCSSWLVVFTEVNPRTKPLGLKRAKLCIICHYTRTPFMVSWQGRGQFEWGLLLSCGFDGHGQLSVFHEVGGVEVPSYAFQAPQLDPNAGSDSNIKPKKARSGTSSKRKRTDKDEREQYIRNIETAQKRPRFTTTLTKSFLAATNECEDKEIGLERLTDIAHQLRTIADELEFKGRNHIEPASHAPGGFTDAHDNHNAVTLEARPTPPLTKHCPTCSCHTTQTVFTNTASYSAFHAASERNVHSGERNDHENKSEPKHVNDNVFIKKERESSPLLPAVTSTQALLPAHLEEPLSGPGIKVEALLSFAVPADARTQSARPTISTVDLYPFSPQHEPNSNNNPVSEPRKDPVSQLSSQAQSLLLEAREGSTGEKLATERATLDVNTVTASSRDDHRGDNINGGAQDCNCSTILCVHRVGGFERVRKGVWE